MSNEKRSGEIKDLELVIDTYRNSIAQRKKVIVAYSQMNVTETEEMLRLTKRLMELKKEESGEKEK